MQNNGEVVHLGQSLKVLAQPGVLWLAGFLDLSRNFSGTFSISEQYRQETS